MASSSRDHDSSSEDEKSLRPIDIITLEGFKLLKLGLGKIEAACCIYEEEYETIGHPYKTRVHPFKEQFQNTYEGT